MKLATQIRSGRAGMGQEKAILDVNVWWGWEDAMVPRKRQLWFNKTLGRYPGELMLEIHDVPEGDHTDL